MVEKIPSHPREVSGGDRDMSEISEKCFPHPREICGGILNDMEAEGVEEQD